MSIPKNHYFNPTPEVASKPHTVRLHTGAVDLELQADRGVFGARRVDLGTLTLLKEAPAPPAEGDILDLGAGYGPIAIALAKASPRARIWAVDVNERALELSRTNAEAAYLVVQRNLGSDSLAAWLAASGRDVDRLKSKKGYRILRVRAA